MGFFKNKVNVKKQTDQINSVPRVGMKNRIIKVFRSNGRPYCYSIVCFSSILLFKVFRLNRKAFCDSSVSISYTYILLRSMADVVILRFLFLYYY